jgi:hypothetical protein
LSKNRESWGRRSRQEEERRKKKQNRNKNNFKKNNMNRKIEQKSRGRNEFCQSSGNQ